MGSVEGDAAKAERLWGYATLCWRFSRTRSHTLTAARTQRKPTRKITCTPCKAIHSAANRCAFCSSLSAWAAARGSVPRESPASGNTDNEFRRKGRMAAFQQGFAALAFRCTTGIEHRSDFSPLLTRLATPSPQSTHCCSAKLSLEQTELVLSSVRRSKRDSESCKFDRIFRLDRTIGGKRDNHIYFGRDCDHTFSTRLVLIIWPSRCRRRWFSRSISIERSRSNCNFFNFINTWGRAGAERKSIAGFAFCTWNKHNQFTINAMYYSFDTLLYICVEVATRNLWLGFIMILNCTFRRWSAYFFSLKGWISNFSFLVIILLKPSIDPTSILDIFIFEQCSVLSFLGNESFSPN